MYFFYLDESGSRDPSIGTAEKPKDHIYVLLAVGMYERHWRPFEMEVSQLKLDLRAQRGNLVPAGMLFPTRVEKPTGIATSLPLLAMRHASYLRTGNWNTDFQNIVEYPFFTRSELSNGVQLADQLAYNVYHAFRYEDMKYSYFERMAPNFYQNRDRTIPYGLKVWPDDSPLIEMVKTIWA